MTAQSINPPFPIFNDVDGNPLEDGFIYIGTENLNAETNLISVYWDADLTIPAAQPIRTLGGYPSRAGTPARIFANSNYSITVRNKNGTFIYSSASVTDIFSADLVDFVQSGTGAVARTSQSKMREIISVADFGTVADGITDDSAAINAASLHASTIASVYNGYVMLFFPPGQYRIAEHLIARDYVLYSGYGVELLGPINGYAPIDGATPVPAASDIVGQTSGGCWTDAAPTVNPLDVGSSISGAMWEGFTHFYFRYGFASRLFAWVYPHIKDVKFISCNICCIAFNGAQMWTIENPTAQGCGVLFVGASTAYTSGNPLSHPAWTGSFCDGLHLYGKGGSSLAMSRLPNVDSWFQSAILRPSDVSVSAGFSGTYSMSTATPAVLAASATNITGKIFHIAQRNARLTFATSIHNIHAILCPRGYGFINNPYNGEISDLNGEGLFLDPTLTAECGVIVGQSNPSECSIELRGIDCAAVTGTTYDSTVGVIVSSTGSRNVYVRVKSSTGNFNPDYLGYLSVAEYSVNSFGGLASIAGNLSHHPITPAVTVYTQLNASQFAITLNSFPERKQDLTGGTSLLKRFLSGSFPGTLGTETVIQFIQPNGAVFFGKSELVQGLLEVYVRRLDTGVQDYGRFLITWPGQNSSTTLTANASIGGTSIAVASGVKCGNGSVILINSVDRYVVKSFTGNTVYLCSALRNNYTSGQTVAGVASIDATLTAFSAGIAAVSFSGTNLTLTNSLGATIPIEYRMEFSYFGSPKQA